MAQDSHKDEVLDFKSIDDQTEIDNVDHQYTFIGDNESSKRGDTSKYEKEILQ